ncbi:M15 family metallopeptidase [Candidatus Woesearchaeota archaeon]|nr:M15 family metallopeptidase [Candidatus Woesearchaeota archaeon]
MDRFLENDWKNFFKAINNEMTFPFKIQITYDHDVINDKGEVAKARETQTACQEVTYVVDNTLLDPRTVVPDFMLYDFVDFLQKSVNALTKVQEQIDRVIDYVAIGCLYTFFAHLVWKIYRNWVELSSEFNFKLQNALVPSGNNQDDEYCNTVAKAVVQSYQLGSLRNLKLKYFSDPDLKKCFPAVYQAWQREENIYQWQRWSCDRIFGHTTPSRWTEKKSDDDLHKKITTQNTCAQDGATQGLKVPVVECRKLEGEFREMFHTPGKHEPFDRKCFKIQYKKDNPLEFYVFTIYPEDQEPQLTANGIYKLKRYEQRPEDKPIYVKKINDNYYLTAQPQTCNDLCGFKEVVQESTINVDGNPYVMEEGKPTVLAPKGTEQEKPKPKRISGCVTVNQCRAWLAKSDSDKEGIKLGKESLKGYTVTDKGYTSDCFYRQGLSPEVVSETNPNTKKICCCINGETTPDLKVYYQPNDKDEKLEAEFAKLTGQPKSQIVHESKSNPLSPPQQKESVNEKGETITESYSDMKFSYRYSRIGYLNKKYNPNRYISGRDLPACFGQDNLFYKIFNKEEELVMINPFKQDTATLQCAYLTGINQRIAMYKNIMSAMSTCLIDIRKDGRADAGVCKELFTQHVCGLLYQLVKFFQDGCTPDYEGDDSDGREAQFGEKVKLGLKGISQGITEAQQEMSQEYQNVRLNNLLGIGQGGVARKVCLAAFGYDWDLSARNLIDAAYTSPFATLVQPITRSREFLTIDPNTLRARYEYRASWIVNPGCDLENYKVELACVSRKQLDQYPNDINCGAVGAPSIGATGALGTSTAYNQCDCLNRPDEQTKSFFSLNTRLKQNQLSDKAHHDVIEDSYRYDHLKITLRTDRRITPEMQKNCFPPGHENGVFYRPITDKTARDIADCTVDPLSGVFKCGEGTSFFASKGIAQILEVKINDVNPDTAKKEELEFEIGKPLYVSARVMKTGKPKCLRVSITPDYIQDQFEKIELDGINEIGPIEITPQLSVTGRGNYETPGIPIDIESQANQNNVYIKTSFTDQLNPVDTRLETAYSLDDKVSIDDFDIDLQGPDHFPNLRPRADLNIENDKANTPRVLIVKRGEQIIEKIILEDKTIRIEKEGVIAVIKDVNYLKQDAKYPGTDKSIWSAQGTITIYPQQQSASSQQTKTITIGVYNIKERKDGTYDLGDCSTNDPVVVKQPPIKILVTKQGAPAEALKPVIGPIRITQSRAVIGEDVVISATITHPLGIKNVQIEINGPDENRVLNEFMSGVGDIFTKTFSTVGKPAGIYTGNIKATSNAKESAERKEGTTSDQKFSFQLIEPKTSTSTAISPAAVSVPTSPAKNDFIGLGSISGLRPEVQQAFDRMKRAAQQDGITLNIISGYRSFDDQLRIWNNKFDSLGAALSEQQKVQNVAQFSAVPGLSRHHLGTEVDINSVDPTDFSGSGRQVAAYNWLSRNAVNFGFCQPYEQGRAIVKNEPWHWSYKQLSKDLTTQHMNMVSSSDLQGKGIKGEQTIISEFNKYHSGFISDINTLCLS